MRVGCSRLQDKRPEEAFSSFLGEKELCSPLDPGESSLPRGRVAEGLETASEKIKLHLRANSIRE